MKFSILFNFLFSSHRRLCQKGGFGPITPSQLLRKIRKSRNSLPVLKQESASHIEEEFPFQNILDAAKLSATEASELGETSAQDIEADPETMDLLPKYHIGTRNAPLQGRRTKDSSSTGHFIDWIFHRLWTLHRPKFLSTISLIH